MIVTVPGRSTTGAKDEQRPSVSPSSSRSNRSTAAPRFYCGFSVTLPSVEALGRWRERGRWAGGLPVSRGLARPTQSECLAAAIILQVGLQAPSGRGVTPGVLRGGRLACRINQRRIPSRMAKCSYGASVPALRPNLESVWRLIASTLRDLLTDSFCVVPPLNLAARG